MAYNIDFSVASSEQIESALCQRIANIRLTRNLTQAQLAKRAGVTRRTITRMENGGGTTLDTFIRVLIALGLQNNLQTLLPDPSIRPVDRVRLDNAERQRARPMQPVEPEGTWVWGDEQGDGE